jgi:DNA-3-methyladenine glycosylase II
MLIESEDHIARAVADLSGRCEVVRRILPLTGAPPLRRAPGGFDGLARIIVDQQLSVASANAIWRKVEATFPDRTPAVILAADDAAMRGAGLSAPKIRTIRAIARAIVDDGLDLDGLGELPADKAKAALTAVKGIGPWTADIYLMFCLGHADAFAPGDLALQEAIRLAFRLPERPTARESELVAERWRPNRAIAARLLWAYYKVEKRRAGLAGA